MRVIRLDFFYHVYLSENTNCLKLLGPMEWTCIQPPVVLMLVWMMGSRKNL